MYDASEMLAFAREARRRAREDDAKICDECERYDFDYGFHQSALGSRECAAAIRAMIEKEKGE